MNSRNRPSVASQRNNNGEMVSGNPIGKAFDQVLQLLHHIGVVKKQSVGNLPNSYPRKRTTSVHLFDPPDQIRVLNVKSKQLP